MQKTLIINGSPRIDGDTATLIKRLKAELYGEVVEISAFRSRIAPCVDCRSCITSRKCAVRDDMDLIYADDFGSAIIASPVYYMTLPGQMLSLMSRFQLYHEQMNEKKIPVGIRPKKAGLILTAGGKGNEDGAMHHIRVFFRMLNAHGFEKHKVLSAKTDTLPAAQDKTAHAGISALAAWLNENPQEKGSE